MAIPVARPSVHLINTKPSRQQARQVVRSVPPPPKPKAKPPRVEVAGRNPLLLKGGRKGALPAKKQEDINRQSQALLGAKPGGAVRNKPKPSLKRNSPRIQIINRDAPVNAREQIEKIRSLRGRGHNRILVMVACGPSMREVGDLSLLGDHPKIDTMTINKPQPPLFPTTMWAFCDHTQYTRNQAAFEQYGGMVINSSSIKVHHPRQILIRARHGKGFSTDLTQGFYIGRSTTFANMQTALWMSYEKVFLFGVDMCEIKGMPLHSYGVNPDVSPNNRVQRFAAEAEHYHYAATSLSEQDRKRFYFCSTYNPWPFVSYFNRRDQKVVVPEILAAAAAL